MTLEKFKEIEPHLQKSMEKAIRKAAKECPEGFLEWLGMKITPISIENCRRM